MTHPSDDATPLDSNPSWMESSKLMSGVAHDARTPLGSVLMMAELLADDPQGTLTDRQLGYAEKIQQAAHEVRQLLTTMSLYGKLRARSLEPQPTTVELRDLVSQTVARVMAERGDDETPPAMSLAPTTPDPVVLDAERFSMALEQLVAAAQEVSPGAVTLQLDGRGQALECQVGDQGPEVTTAELDELFVPFASGARRWRSQGGHSLRLPLAQAIAEWAGGRIEPRSSTDGLTLCLLWPLATET